MAHLRAEGLSKEYPRRRRRPAVSAPGGLAWGGTLVALAELDLGLVDGQISCIVGPPGAGKTTLCRILAGLERPTHGRVLADGVEVRGPRAADTFVFQHRSLLPWMTVWENVTLGAPALADQEEPAERAKGAIHTLALAGLEDRYPHQLPSDVQRRVELARALTIRSDVLFMDDPFGCIVLPTRLKLREEVVRLHNLLENTIVFVTREVDEALVLAQRVVLLSGPPGRAELCRDVAVRHPRDLENDPQVAGLREELNRGLRVRRAAADPR